MRSVPRLHLAPRPSRVLALAALVAGLSTAVLLFVVLEPMALAASAAGLCVLVSLREVARLRHGPQRVIVSIDRSIRVTGAKEEVEEGTVIDATYVSGAFTAVVWRPHGCRRARVWAVAPDSLGAEDRRRLRVLLRYATAPPEGVADPRVDVASSSLVIAGAPDSHA